MPSISLDQVLACPNLPSLPAVAVEVLALTTKPNVSLEEIARTPLQRGCRQIRWRPDILKHARFLFAPRHH